MGRKLGENIFFTGVPDAISYMHFTRAGYMLMYVRGS